MKKLSSKKMASVNGGLRCIYHFMALPILGIWNVFGNGQSAYECWNNSHAE